MLVTQSCLSLSDPMDPTRLLSMEFYRQEHWSELPFPSPGDLPEPRINPKSPVLQAYSLHSEPPGKPICVSPFVNGEDASLGVTSQKIFVITLFGYSKSYGLIFFWLPNLICENTCWIYFLKFCHHLGAQGKRIEGFLLITLEPCMPWDIQDHRNAGSRRPLGSLQKALF